VEGGGWRVEVLGKLFEEQDLVVLDGRGNEAAGDDQLLLRRLARRLLLERLVGLLYRTLQNDVARRQHPPVSGLHGKIGEWGGETTGMY
jgi:hypothetical protein